MSKATVSAVHAAERLYNKGKTYAEIGKKIGITPATVGKWKKKYGWSRDEQPSSGAPKGNKNATGAGALPRNQNATTHGGYARLLHDALTDEEREYLDGQGATDDEEAMLLADIRLLDIRIARLMKQIHDIKKPGGLYVDSASTSEERRKFKTPEEQELYDEIQQSKVDSGEMLPGTPYRVVTTTKNTEEFILSVQEALSRAQAQKNRCVDTLIKLRELRKAENPDADIEDLQALRKAVFGDHT